MSRVTDLVKGALELNLRYTSTLLHLSKDYLKDANEVLKREPAAPAPPPDAPPAQRPPLLVVGRAGELANGAFAINNPTEREIDVHLVVQGELDERHVRVDPARLKLKAGESAIVRILASIDDKMPVDRDHVGTVVAPGLSNQGVPFIVRRLAAVPADGPVDAPANAPGDTAADPAQRAARAKRKDA